MTKREATILEGGERLVGVHSPDKCLGENCTIHNMSNHQLRKFVQHWNGVYMERIDLGTGDIWADPDDPRKPERPNAARCTECDEVLYSQGVHDFIQCSGGHVFVDGGTHYARRGFDTPEHLEEIVNWPVPSATRRS